ncbi:ABC-type lipoprotein export system ATPase subunit [Bifidobacterium commune]|uniref:ABC-type lipoprotein export system, ATPase component n=1 Tax=Bifidobacterium commune TaxID=1505727 RepID=A0A1C4H622_9BIFI|nr:ATP-binding cassette domain-containing protein [Bifidobacterium commune]MBB2955701.1 ABC-type lipoprotein export system ATPase subunit [Bifidobacterium commune]SCC80128.1 ABC-type lipoprotein export system, ATPase component [Bifidobacterium commune]
MSGNNTDPKDEAMNKKSNDGETPDDTTDTSAERTDPTTPAIKYDVVFEDDDALDLVDLTSAGTMSSTDHASDENASDSEESTSSDNDSAVSNHDDEDRADSGKAVADESATVNAKRANETLGVAIEEDNELDTHEEQSPVLEPATVVSSKLDRDVIAETDILLKPNPTFALDHITVINRKSGRNVLDDINWSFFAGSLYAIAEADEEQRRALLAVASGFRYPDNGQVMIKSQSLPELETNEIRGHRIGLITQRYSVRDDLDALGTVTFTMRASGRTFLKPIAQSARDMLKIVDFNEATTGVPVSELKPVDQRRLAIARAICCEATVIIADNPAGGLDEDDRRTILDLLARLAHMREPKRCIIMVEPSTEALGGSGDHTTTDYEDKADKIYSF